jgi:hypothetical protein
MELSTGGPMLEPLKKPEHKVKIYDEKYHETDIRVLELDHHDSEQAGIEYKLPRDWKEQLRSQIEITEGSIAPEYCVPDIEKYLFNNSLTSGLLRAHLGEGKVKDISTLDSETLRENPDITIHSFYSHISKIAGVMQRDLIATDTANKGVYWLFSGASIAKHKGVENQRQFSGVGTKFKYEYGKIDESEYKRHDSNNGRHLVSARGLMQEALRTNEKQITAIWAPKHAERIADYINRQTTAESSSTVKVEKPGDFRYVSPPDEAKKMILYGRPPLMRSVRTYKPILSPEAYEIDIMANVAELHHDKLIIAIHKYLEQPPKNEQEKKYRRGLKQVLSKEGDAGWVKKVVNTDKIGWVQTQKEHVY